MDSRGGGGYQPSERAAHLLTRVIYRRECLDACASFHRAEVQEKNEKGEKKTNEEEGDRHSLGYYF